MNTKENQPKITINNIESAEIIAGLKFKDEDRNLLLEGVNGYLNNYKKLRDIVISNDISPSQYFSPILPGMEIIIENKPIQTTSVTKIEKPEDLEELAFWSILELAYLIKNQKITSVELTKVYLGRLKRYDSILECTITITEELAMKQAEIADQEIKNGNYRGLLHGIPYGLKDLFAIPNYPTTWGATPFKDQMIDEIATIAKKLEDAGAVLIAKLTLGALAWGDVWFGGQTKSPWNTDEGSSGSSAGSSAAVASGLVGFAIGTETYGSIISPSTRCGVTGLRPTFGRISRHGAMALCWSMDKIGPICRTVEDCAIILDIIQGPDGKDLSVHDIPFNWDFSLNLHDIRIGYIESAFEEERENLIHDLQSLEVLRNLGCDLIPVKLPKIPSSNLSVILAAEAATAFDELTISKRDSELVRQVKDAWPNVFRQARFIPAVEYIKANRVRTLLMYDMKDIFDKIDVYIAPSSHENLLLTNLTGHPAVVVPNGFRENGLPTSITFTGNLFREDQVLIVAKAYQDKTNFHNRRPVVAIKEN